MPDSATLFNQLCEQVQAGMERLQVPGVALGVLHGDQEFTAGFGVTSVENPLPVDTDTLFQIGSTTKTITGTLAMRLVEQGKLSLDAPVRTYLPELRLSDPGVAEKVTLRHLLTHTAGWVGDVFDDTGWGDDALARMVAQMADIPQLTPLGTAWSYNNAGFYLAGRLIEVATGLPYETAARELLLDPLGMTHSFFLPGDVMTYRFACGHIVHDDGPRLARPWALARNANPVGGLSSSVRDQLRYARFCLGDGATPDGTRLLQTETMRQMQSPLVETDPFGGWRGLTWILRDVGGVRTVAHGGATNGQLSAFQLAPDQRFAVTVLTNADRGVQLHTEAVQWALEHFVGAVEPERPPLSVGAAELAEYAGYYEGRLSDIELTVRDGGLVMQVIPNGGFPLKSSPPGPTPPPARLALIGRDMALGTEAPFKDTRCHFLRDDQGQVEWFHFGGRIRRRRSGSE